MDTLEYEYNGQVIEFLFKDDLMVNATEMAKAFGKEVYNYTRLEQFKTIIEALEKSSIRENRTEDSSVRFSGNEDFIGELKHRTADLVPLMIVQKGGDEGGCTWMHRYLAIDFAMWLDVDFKIWILRKIDELLLNYTTERRSLAIRKKRVKEKMNKIFSESEIAEVKELEKLFKEQNQIKGEEFNLNKNFNRNLFSQ